MNGRRIFRGCMVGAALIIGGVAIYFVFAYLATSIAVGNSGLKPFYQQSLRAMWLAFCAQLGLLAVVLLYAAGRPRGISRQMVTVLAFMPMLSTVMLFWFAASRVGGAFLGAAALLMLIAAFAWPTDPTDEEAAVESQTLVRSPGGPRGP